MRFLDTSNANARRFASCSSFWFSNAIRSASVISCHSETLYDVIRGGEEPFSDELKRHFFKARDLYDHRIRPVLLAEHQLDDEAARSLPDAHAFRTDDRIVKTLLLAALVPDVAPLRGLTVRRLADLNHGTISTPIPGAEKAAVLTRLREWALQIPELHLGDDEQDPTVSLRLSGVDVKAILDQAAHVDNVGARRTKIRHLVTEALKLQDGDTLLPLTRTWIWRGSKRNVDVLFANVRDETDIPNAEFRAGSQPRVVIDFPFDDANHGPADDLVRMELLQGELDPTPTVAWLPSFFTEGALNELGQLVVLDYVLAGDRLGGYTTHLSPPNRIEAKHLLENQADSLRQHLQDLLRQAYGIETPDDRWVSDELRPREQFPTLDPTLAIRPPTSATLSDAFDQILDQLMSHLFPAHPEFEDEVRVGDLRTVLKHVERAVGERDQRVEIPQPDRRAVRKVLGPLDIATTGEAHIMLERHWKDHFHAREAEDPGRAVTVERLKRWIDVPSPMGIDERVANLVISSYALSDDRVLILGGQTIQPNVDRLEPQTEVRTQQLPSKEDWEAARPIAHAVLGVQSSPILSAASVLALVSAAQEVASEHETPCRSLIDGLHNATQALGGAAEGDRIKTATAALDLLEAVRAAESIEVVSQLAKLEPPTSAQALGRSIKSAEQVSAAMERAQWKLFGLVTDLAGEWGEQGRGVRDRVIAALEHEELAEPLPDLLDQENRIATDLLAEAARQATTPGKKPPRPRPKPALDSQGSAKNLSGEEAKPILEELSQRSDELEHIDVSWRFKDLDGSGT